MIELSGEQSLQIALAVACAAVAVIAAVFLLVLHATRRRRGLGWFWGWAFLSVTFGLLALAHHWPPREAQFAFAATCTAIVSGFAGAAGAYSFRSAERMPPAGLAALAAAAVAALFVQAQSGFVGDFVAPEIPFTASLFVQAIVLLPMARGARKSGLQTVCGVEIVLAALLVRTLAAAAVLAARGEQLAGAYWIAEVAGAVILLFVLGMGELVAILDEVRVELEGANDALKQALEGLEVAAKLDPLTGLYNRYAFYTLIAELTEARKLQGSIAIIDLNGLKRINDTYGHHAGDRALLNTAMRLQEVVRQADFVFRWGGDEFVTLLLGMSPDRARERLARMSQPMPLDVSGRDPVLLTVSWGVAPLSADVDAALHDADEQLYGQKRL